MGLDTTHNCWSGSYSGFGAWREKLAEVAGYGDLNEYVGFGLAGNSGKPWLDPKEDPLVYLLHHSDCDGSIASGNCRPLADRLETLLPSLQVADRVNAGHSWYVATTERFIAGLRAAAEAGEDVMFH